jgi:hypothetical protein
LDHRVNRDYDCRPKWMAVAAVARQESDEAVSLLVRLVDHGNQNTRQWARAACLLSSESTMTSGFPGRLLPVSISRTVLSKK